MAGPAFKTNTTSGLQPDRTPPISVGRTPHRRVARMRHRGIVEPTRLAHRARIPAIGPHPGWFPNHLMQARMTDWPKALSAERESDTAECTTPPCMGQSHRCGPSSKRTAAPGPRDQKNPPSAWTTVVTCSTTQSRVRHSPLGTTSPAAPRRPLQQPFAKNPASGTSASVAQ